MQSCSGQLIQRVNITDLLIFYSKTFPDRGYSRFSSPGTSISAGLGLALGFGIILVLIVVVFCLVKVALIQSSFLFQSQFEIKSHKINCHPLPGQGDPHQWLFPFRSQYWCMYHCLPLACLIIKMHQKSLRSFITTSNLKSSQTFYFPSMISNQSWYQMKRTTWQYGVKVFQRMRTFKNDFDVARAPKTDDNHYYGIYYRFDFQIRFVLFIFSDRTGPKSTSPSWRWRTRTLIMNEASYIIRNKPLYQDFAFAHEQHPPPFLPLFWCPWCMLMRRIQTWLKIRPGLERQWKELLIGLVVVVGGDIIRLD